jgi:hypothetical protein
MITYYSEVIFEAFTNVYCKRFHHRYTSKEQNPTDKKVKPPKTMYHIYHKYRNPHKYWIYRHCKP